MKEAKALIHSHTFQIAVAQAILGAVLVFTAAYPELQALGVVAILKSVLDTFIRVRTEQPIDSVLP